MKRYLHSFIEECLTKKMAFVAGPRQVGKTTLSLSLLGPEANETHPSYFNWDQPLVAKRILKLEFPIDEKVLILDEIHKYKNWRNLVKGIFDTLKSKYKIIVTGSARLDIFRRGGDSLFGRYRLFRLHPLSLAEVSSSYDGAALNRLLKFGGFPEPYFAATDRDLRLWQNERLNKVLKQDLRDLESVKDISMVENLALLLTEQVGGLLSIKSLAQNLSVDFKTCEKWISVLEKLFYCYRIPPYATKTSRMLTKAKKIFLWDWSILEDEGSRFENLVASQLLKYCHFNEDTEGYVMELCYMRNTAQLEVDFVVLKDKKPLFAVEAKSRSATISKAVKYFAGATTIPTFYQVHLGDESYQKGNICVLPFVEFCKLTGMP